jgi:hypothetical protein
VKYNRPMDIHQIYETTLFDETGKLGFSALTIPARSIRRQADYVPDASYIASDIFDAEITEEPQYFSPDLIYNLIAHGAQEVSEENRRIFSAYIANAQIIPFEESPLGADSLASIALKAAKMGTVGVGTTIGILAAGTPMLLIVVPLGIVLCGAAISFAKWLDENRNTVWNRIAGFNVGPNLLGPAPHPIKAPPHKKRTKTSKKPSRRR